jgi:ABC-type sugar transport system substrate-binding protein
MNMQFGKKIAAAIGFGLCLTVAPVGAMAKEQLKARKLGIVVINTQSESLANWANHLAAAAEKLGWTPIIKNGESNPAVVATLLPELLTQGVDAIITMAVDAPLMTQGLAAAKAKNVPVIATVVGVNPAGKENFTAVYAVNDRALGVALANYLVDKNPKAVAVGQTATLVYAADQLVVGAKETLAKRGASMAAVQDNDVTNLVTSFTQTTSDLALSHPEASALISCCDFAPLMDLPALKAANRSDMTLMTRVDNPSTIQAMKAGANVVVAAFRTDRYNLLALDALVAHFGKNTPIPAATTLDGDIKVVDKDHIPASGAVYPFADELAPYVARWQEVYQF